MSWFVNSRLGHTLDKWEAIDRWRSIVEFSPEGVVLSVNDAFSALMGYRPNEVVGKHHSIFVEAAETRKPEYVDFWRKRALGEPETGYYLRVRKDGSRLYIGASYNPVRDKKGKVCSVVVLASDISPLMEREMEVRAKMTALSLVQAIVEFTPTGEITDANDNFFRTMGYTREQVIGKRHSLFVDPTYAHSREYQEFWDKLRAGESIVDSFHRLGAGGKRVWLQASYCPVLDLSGKVFKIVKFAYDITDLLLLADSLSRLAAGDVSHRLDVPFSSTFDKLRHDYNQAAVKLSDALTSVTDATRAVGVSTREISSASNDLSQRTESQAASLAETSAALEKVTQVVRKSTETARRANQVVGAAKGDAEKSGEIVGRAVGAMGRIEQSSDEIGKIIGVIDEIAFQTNLLALNAGVEAARAGDAGRGFAVVASEVRALAQRSAEAAKQIKALISASGTDVKAGVTLVRQTGDALAGIVGQVTEISGLVSGIASAAEEQNNALAEVNGAVAQMDQSTQQNAALAEEANAAVASTEQQIARLLDLVQEFRLAGAPGAAPVRARGAAPARAA